MALGPDIDTNYLTLINNAEFMCQTRGYLIDDMLIGTYRELVAGQLAKALGYLSTAIVTAWLIVQGFMIVSGTNKTPLMTLMIQTIKIVGIMVVVSILAGNSPWIAEMVLGVQGLITAAIVGGGTDIYQIVDMNLAVAQIFNAVIEGLVGGQQSGADGNHLTKMAGVIGQSGPAVLVSIMAIMAEISITLAIMLAPLFIFFLMFKQTSSMFATWLKFLLGTMVSFALLTLLSSVLLDMMMRYGAAVIAAFYTNGALAAAGVSVVSFDISGSAMQLAALGSLSTALLLMVPPLIMQFFNSGASFATGAMMGMMGGGAAGMGAAGVMNAMGGQGGQGALGTGGVNGANGAAGQPGVGYSDPSGASQNVGSRSVLQALMARSGQSGENSAGLNAPGSRGLANQGGQGNQFAAVQAKQATMGGEMRSGSNVSNPVAAKSSGGANSYGAIEDAQIKADHALGRGGHLPVGGDAPSVGSQVPLNGPSKSAASGNEYAGPVVPPVGSAPSTPPPPGGSGASTASSASASSDTPVYSAAPVRSGMGSRSTGQAASLRYGQQRR
jgi:type IV secretion system protein VirB6